jgi:hypothetical protein
MMRTNIEMGWEVELGLEALEDEALELEQLPIQPGPKVRNCADPRIPKTAVRR